MPIAGVGGGRLPRFTKVIAVADVVESVRLMEEDEGEFIRRWKRFVGFVLQRLPLESGRMHRSLGDGLMIEFSDPQGCIRAALAMQAWFAEGNEGLAPEQQVHLRIGAHIGDFVADEYDIYGTDVNLAARIATLAGPGEIVISAALRECVRGEMNAQLEDLGACHLKHVKQPVRAYRVGYAGPAPVMPAMGPLRANMRASVAVLPFETSTSPGASNLGQAVADEALAALSRSDGLQVVSRLSTVALGQARPTLDDVRRHLGTRYVLSGHAREIAGQLAVFAELTDATSGHIVWADSFKGKLPELLAGGSTFLSSLAPLVNAAVMANEVERAEGLPLPALEGYALLLTSIAVMHRLGRADMDRARLMLEHLADRDRRHPSAYAWLAHWYVLGVLQGTLRADEAAPLAASHIQSALQCDPQAPLVLCMAGHAAVHLAQDLRAAGEYYAQAVASRPYDALPHLLQAELLAWRGQGEPARASCATALRLVPPVALRYWYDAGAALACWVDGALDAAVSAAEQSLRANG
ncbi:MAG TPA: adenylate/guanylate cyclase domain-containing protein, partial [Ramlibacter sp.]